MRSGGGAAVARSGMKTFQNEVNIVAVFVQEIRAGSGERAAQKALSQCFSRWLTYGVSSQLVENQTVFRFCLHLEFREIDKFWGYALCVQTNFI